MKRVNNEMIDRTEEWLDERWLIATMDDARTQDVSFYNGATQAIQWLGFNWERNEEGKHIIY